MKDNKTGIVILLYNRLFDPLVQSNFWLYIDDFLNDTANPYQFHVISYEDDHYPLTDEQARLVDRWKTQGLEWTALPWHQGTGMVSKLVDLSAAFRKMLNLRLRGFSFVVGYGSVSGTMAYLCARPLGMSLFIHTFEPHSEYSRDSGVWSENSWGYRALNYFENQMAHFAKVIASGTCFMQERLQTEWGVKGKFFKIPSVANEQKFLFSKAERDSTRNALGLTNDQWVMLYSGKFGGLYYKDEMALIFRWLKEMESRLHLLIVSPQSDIEIHEIFSRVGVPLQDYSVVQSEYHDIHKYYFAADFGINILPPSPVQKYRSPIKVGEFLCSGLPFLTNYGVSEDYLIAEEKNVGAVIQDITTEEIMSAWQKIKAILSVPADKRRAHCREVGIEYRGFTRLNPTFKNALLYLVR